MTSSNDIAFRLPRSRRSVPRARALLHAVLGGWGVGQETLDNAALVLSELVTNALRVRRRVIGRWVCGSTVPWRTGCCGWR